MRQTEMRVSLGVLEKNARAIRASIDPRVKLMAVVKADAYGHGIAEGARAFLKGGAQRLAVAISEEAAALRRAGITSPILILGGACRDSIFEAVEADAAQAVFNAEMLRCMQEAARKLGRRAKAHLKIDTGMSRIGVRGDAELKAVLEAWKACPDVEMEGIFTHFCVSETDPEFTAMQNNAFERAVQTARAAGFAPIAHAAATGAFLDARYQHDMVRPGLAMYGMGAPVEGIEPAQTLATYPVRIERISRGDTVSYGRIFRAERDTLVMTVPIGYGDGYPRLLSGRAQALVRGQRVNQIGRVCMDMTMFDVTDVPGVSLEDEVVLMGTQCGERIAPQEMADLVGTIPYEIMLGFLPRVRRVYVD